MKIKINSVEHDFPEGTTLAAALAACGVRPEGIAAAVNGSVVPKKYHTTTQLADGDSIIIIKAFYGG